MGKMEQYLKNKNFISKAIIAFGLFGLVLFFAFPAFQETKAESGAIPENSCLNEPLLEGENFEVCQRALSIWADLLTPPKKPHEIKASINKLVDTLIEAKDPYGASFILFMFGYGDTNDPIWDAERDSINEKILNLLENENHPASRVFYAAALSGKAKNEALNGNLTTAQEQFDLALELSSKYKFPKLEIPQIIILKNYTTLQMATGDFEGTLETAKKISEFTNSLEFIPLQILEDLADDLAAKSRPEAISVYTLVKNICPMKISQQFCNLIVSNINGKIKAITEK